MRPNQILIIAGLLLLYSILYGNDVPGTLCLIITAFSIVNFIQELGRQVAIRSLTFMIATVQWVLGPYLSYNFLNPFEYYYMPVPEEEYFALAIPGVLLFALGLYSIKDKYIDAQVIIPTLKKYIEGKPKVGIYLILLGFLFTYIGPLLPAALAFFFTFLLI